MLELIKAFSSTPLWILAIAAVAYVGRGWFEGALKSRFTVLESRIASSLEIKQGLRTHEQDELVDFRVAIENWEYFLQTGIADLTIESESQDFKPADFHKRDLELFGAVRIAAVKASIFLRDPDLEIELLKTINAIRGLYYPRLEMTMQSLMDLLGQMLPYLNRMRLFEANGEKDTSIALKPEEAQVLIGLRHQMSSVLQGYAEGLAADYRPIAEQLYDLKAKINVHIYRPLASAEIDSRVG